ncbi:MAG: barstar family protein [Elusimicrobia bacterium]|nr:barstar family protein [Elusimicrobiota bacterium]
MKASERVVVDLSKVRDEASFHRAFADAMGFPGFYGANMDAWIDCMSYIDSPSAGMSRVTVKPGGTLELELKGAGSFKKARPELMAKLVECTGSVNERFEDSKDGTRIVLVEA